MRMLFVALLVTASGCTNTTPHATKSQSETSTPAATAPSPPAQSQTANETSAAPGSTSLRSGGPTGPASNYSRGSAHVSVRGDVTATHDLPLDPDGSVYSDPPHASGLLWINDANDSLQLFGELRSGKTSDRLKLAINLPEFRFTATSAKGECTLTFTSSAANRVAGSYSCPGWHIGGKTISSSGTFDAS